MTSPRIGIVWNPSKIERDELSEALERLEPGAAEAAQWYETTVEDPGRGATRDALDGGAELVIVAGGDGTVRAAAEMLAGSGVPMGIVPQGTGNLLARNLEVPLGSIDKALARALDAGQQRTIDIGWVDIEGDDQPERAFTVMVGFGLDAQMLSETDEDLKDKAGWLAYVEAMGRAVSASEVVDVTLTLDDGEPQRISAHTLLIGNCGTLQGGVALLPDALFDDGRLDLLVVSADSPAQWLETLKTFVWDNGVRKLFVQDASTVSSDTALHLSGERARVELPSPTLFEIDGEEVGDAQAFTVRLDPAALVVR
ncbi:diacylglycerol/lipid kinase family protein [Microbacterium aureliae]